jgi:hypothetical protein
MAFSIPNALKSYQITSTYPIQPLATIGLPIQAADHPPATNLIFAIALNQTGT